MTRHHHLLSAAHRPPSRIARAWRMALRSVLLVPLTLLFGTALAQTPLADQPLFSTSGVPGNLAFALSVEFPTAVSVAHISNNYDSSVSYLGYFDSNKCYLYQPYAPETAAQKSHFYPAGSTTTRTCVGANDQKWSGNYLNWATMQTVDPFRSALTGGNRAIDTASTTILEKAYASGQGGYGNFPNRILQSTNDVAGATPFTSASYTVRVQGLGTRMTMAGMDGASGSMLGQYFNNVDLTGNPVLTRFDTVDFDWGSASPGTGVNADNFSARWTNIAVAPATGTYSFQTVSDNGVRLYVNGTLVINNWTDHASTTDTSANIVLNQGDPIAITMEYYERGGGASARLRWRTPSDGAGVYNVYRPRADSQNTGSDGYADPQMFVRVKVCDSSVAAGGIESNCTAYGGNYKPQGLIQKYADRIRYSAFGYLNDGNLRRDGGVLRARQKFVGPVQPRPGSSSIANVVSEWDGSTGVFIDNPDATDAASTATAYSTAVSNSGVVNYINKFGRSGLYKGYDPVSELYYAVVRYFKNQNNVPEWSNATGADSATRAQWIDGFPVITTWDDPIQYSCQKNFILGIGDVNTHADKNVPGSTGTADEPTKPSSVANDSSYTATMNPVTETDRVGALEGLGTLGTTPYTASCCSNHSAFMAGMAYEMHTRDIRPDNAAQPQTAGKQTVSTYWIDVLEGQTYRSRNQFWLTAKYGGFTVPDGFNPDTRGTTALEDALWWTNGQSVGNDRKPDNYFTAGRPDDMVSGLTSAFDSIAANLSFYSTSSATETDNLRADGTAQYSGRYDTTNWTGDIEASLTTFPGPSNSPIQSVQWRASQTLANQIGNGGWDASRRVVSWDPVAATGVAFRSSGASALSAAQLALLNPSYTAASDAAQYLNYIRGDRSNEAGATGALGYRARRGLLGDVVNAKLLVVGPPPAKLDAIYSDSTNPGYTAFRSTWAARPRMVYAGANDGMLHGFNAGSGTNTGTGAEVFAYVPNAVLAGPNNTPSVDGLAALGNPTFIHHYYVDSSPVAFDVDLARTGGPTSRTAPPAPNWRTLLIGGLGKGGRSYYAIDITDPAGITSETAAASRVLWEFPNASTPAADAALFGLSYGIPVVTKTAKWGWVVVFGSGYNNGGAGQFFFVNPRTGALLERVSTGAGTAATPAGLAHIGVYSFSLTDNTAESLYAGDLLGNLWRLDVRQSAGGYEVGGSTPNPRRLATLSSATVGGTAQPVTTAPLIEIEPETGDRYVIVATGRLLDPSDLSGVQGQTFYAIKDGNRGSFNTTLPAGVSFPITRSNLVNNSDLTAGFTPSATQLGWFKDLGVGPSGSSWGVSLQPQWLAGEVSFAATSPSTDLCANAVSRVYEFRVANGKSTLISTGNSPTSIEYTQATTGVINSLAFQRMNTGSSPGSGGGTETGSGNNSASNGQYETYVCDSTGKCVQVRTGRVFYQRRLNWRVLPSIQ